jgi:predicted permease
MIQELTIAIICIFIPLFSLLLLGYVIKILLKIKRYEKGISDNIAWLREHNKEISIN